MPQERRDRRLFWGGVAVFLASMAFLAHLNARDGEQAAAIKQNSRRIADLEGTTREAIAGHARILAELEAIRQLLERRP
jgi:hypothetical protein